jgi:diadenosine tetraphosphate (Ap4A) HIT family hydrolase
MENGHLICDLQLSKLIIKNDKDNPWFILVPRKVAAVELIDLTHEEQTVLMEEVTLVSEFLKEYYRPYKINIGALGNIVRQLHVHVIARFENDRAWPNPIWNTAPVQLFEKNELVNIQENFKEFIN